MKDVENHHVVHYGNTRKSSVDEYRTVNLRGGVTIKILEHLDNKSSIYKDEVVNYISQTGKYCYTRAVEFNSGLGVLGFELLGMGVCNNIVFVDANNKSIDCCLETAKINKLSNYVSGYSSNIPVYEKWDLAVTNLEQEVNIDFIKNIKNHMSSGADLYVVKSEDFNSLLHLTKLEGLRFVGKKPLKHDLGTILHFKLN
jgi:hypothetical protein